MSTLGFRRIYMKKIIGLLLSAITSVAFAQINESDTLRFQFRSSLTGLYQTGNVELLSMRSRLDLALHVSKAIVFKTQNNYGYQEFSGRKADEDIFSRNYLYYKPERTVYPYAIAYISTNLRRKLDLRYFAGAGITYQLYRSAHAVLKLSANMVYEESSFRTSNLNDTYYAGQQQINLWRGTLFVAGSTWILNRKVRLYYDAYWQPAVERTDNYRTQFDVGLDVPVWKGLSLNGLYTYTRESVVPVTTKTDDGILTFGLSYSLVKK